MFADWPDSRDQAHPCRPTVSCTADIVAPGRLEVEAGALITPLVQLQVGSNGYTLVDSTPSVRYFDNGYFGPRLHRAYSLFAGVTLIPVAFR